MGKSMFPHYQKPGYFIMANNAICVYLGLTSIMVVTVDSETEKYAWDNKSVLLLQPCILSYSYTYTSFQNTQLRHAPCFLTFCSSDQCPHTGLLGNKTAIKVQVYGDIDPMEYMRKTTDTYGWLKFRMLNTYAAGRTSIIKLWMLVSRL